MVTIDSVTYDWPASAGTIYQFCYEKGIVLPCFCYHEKLSIAGNCRMCLVEANGALAASCAIPILDNMQVITQSQRLLHARESVLEFLLINHPLDCPICDQGGECDLQDISMSFGLDRGRFYETKRAVDNLNCCGPLIKTVMTRCIHCTRCVRFLNEYCDVFDLGVLGRGSLMEIGTYIEKFTLDALSANIIDLCPVGALTSMPYAFTARPWELKAIESIDVLDALAASIRIDVVNNQVARISPILMEAINEDWLTNKARFSYDALMVQRLYYPRLIIAGGSFTLSWIKALTFFLRLLSEGSWKEVMAETGSFLDLESASALKDFFNSFGCSNISYEKLSFSGANLDFRFSYLLNVTLSFLEEASFVILLSANLRLENPLLNSRLRKNYMKNRGQKHKNFTVLSFGQGVSYGGYPIVNLGHNLKIFFSFLEGKYYYFNNIFFNPFSFRSLSFFNVFIPFHLRPILLVGASSLAYRPDFSQALQAAQTFAKILSAHAFLNKFIFNVIYNTLGELSLKEVGIGNYVRGRTLLQTPKFSYLLGTSQLRRGTSQAQDFTIFQGSHMPSKNDFNFSSPILLLPTATYVERLSTYVNLEGRIRITKIAVASPPMVLSDLEVLRLLTLLKRKVNPSNFSILSDFYESTSFFDFLINYKSCFFGTLRRFLEDFIYKGGFKLRAFSTAILIKPYWLNLLTFSSGNLKFTGISLAKPFINYYATDFLSRNSKVMGLCSTRLLISSFSEK